MGWLIGKQVLDFWQQKKFSSLSVHTHQTWAHSTSNQYMLRAFSLEVRCLRHEVNHSPTSNVMIKNVCSYTTITPYVIITGCLIKHRDGFSQSQNSAFFLHYVIITLGKSIPLFWQKQQSHCSCSQMWFLPRKFCDHPQTL